MVDWSSVDWNLVAHIAGSTWGITVLVCSIAWVVAWIMGLVVRKTIKTTTEAKEGSAKDK